MKSLRPVLLAVLIGLLALATGVLAQGDTAQVRFFHAIPGAASVDIYTDGQLTISGLEFGAGSNYVNVPAGEHQLTVNQSGTQTVIWQQTMSAPAGLALTLIAVATEPPSFVIYQDDLNPLPLGKARFGAVHTISGGPAVDLILTDGRTVLPGLEFGQGGPLSVSTLDVPTFTYDFAVVPAGEGADTALAAALANLDSGAYYLLVVYGTAESAEASLLAAPTTPSAPSGFVRIAHGIAGAPDVDVYLNDTLAVPALAFGSMTEHVAVPEGSYDVVVRAAGTDQSLLTATLPVTSGTAVTVAALGTPDTPEVKVFTDDISGMNAALARLSLINGVTGDSSINATLEDGTALASSIPYGEASRAISIPASRQKISVNVTVDGETTTLESPEASFYGGVYHNILVVNEDGEPRVFWKSTGITQGIASAPGAGEQVVEAQPTLQPPPAETIQPTEVAVQATVAPTIPPQPTILPTPTGPTGRVFNMDPDRNLQLRQYPNSDALSLGTVPPGTILIVNGREGALEPIPNSSTPVPADYEFVDPVTALADEKADLDPQATWLNVIYIAPDGGSVTAWANALYVDVRDPRGQKLPLRDLPMVAGNLPGEVNSTAVISPTGRVDRVTATVFNLDPGVNLNIRRTADPNSEVLARVGNGTVMEFLGLKEDRQWAFVQYNPPEGGSVTGWVNALYVTYAFNNQPINLEQMEQRNLLTITPDDQRGEVAAGVGPAAVPTRNPTRDAIIAEVILDPGANLNLRRGPDVNAEVLAQLPSGTQVIVSERTGDGRWLKVTLEGVEGWIAASTDTASFVRLSLNSRPFDIANVPVSEGETDVVPATTLTPGVQTAPTQAGELPFDPVPVIVNDVVVAMTGSPGGSSDGLPILSAGMEATRLFTDGTFSYIELPDGTRGWVPAGSIRLK